MHRNVFGSQTLPGPAAELMAVPDLYPEQVDGKGWEGIRKVKDGRKWETEETGANG